jgi:glutamyl-tRNA synthetase
MLMPLLKKNNINASAEYVEKVAGLMKEKVAFTNEIWETGKYFFIEPEYDLETIRKKLKEFTPAFLNAIKDHLLTTQDFNASNIEHIFNTTVADQGLKPGDVLQSFRLAVSGATSGPPVFEMVETLGKEKVVERLVNILSLIPVA